MATYSSTVVNPYYTNTEIDNLNFISRQQKSSYSKLPFNIRLWAYYEQAKNPQAYDPDFFPKPSETMLPSQYMPGSRSILQLEAWRLPNGSLSSSSTAQNRFLKQFNNNDGTHTILVHPSMSNPQVLASLGATQSTDTYYFIPLASPRTGITWKEGNEHAAFISKMSIKPNSNQSGQSNSMSRVKSDLGTEARMSVAKTTSVERYFQNSNSYLFDQYSLELKQDYSKYTNGLGSYGVLYREIPSNILNSEMGYIPFFALASQDRKPLIATLIEKSGVSIEQFLKRYIFTPVVDFILFNSQHGIYPEHLHGQNLLINVVQEQQSVTGIKQIYPKVTYRDIADLKIASSAETQACRNYRLQNGGRECIFTPGSYIYEAASQFVLCSLMPIINVIVNAQQQGFLPSEQYNYADPNRLCLEFFKIILDNLRQANSVDSIYEFASLANVTNNLYIGTMRERKWITDVSIQSKQLYTSVQEFAEIDAERYDRLTKHIQDFTQDTQMQMQAINRSRSLTMSNSSGIDMTQVMQSNGIQDRQQYGQTTDSIYMSATPWVPVNTDASVFGRESRVVQVSCPYSYRP